MVKKNNNVWLVYVIALIAIVALILAAIAFNKANMTGQGLLDFLKGSQINPESGQGSPPNTNLISANSCDADSKCEMNRLDVMDAFTVHNNVNAEGQTVGSLYSNLGKSYLTITSGVDQMSYVQFVTQHNPSPGVFQSVYWSMGTDGTDEDKFIISDSGTLGSGNRLTFKPLENTIFGDYPTQFEDLIGTGNAYACLDNQGILYRSTTPCV